jgi:hypothetical protein
LAVSVLLAIADFLDPDAGPEQTGDFRVSPRVFLVLLGLGFAVAAIGHLVRARLLVAIGVMLVLLATVLLPIGYALWN